MGKKTSDSRKETPNLSIITLRIEFRKGGWRVRRMNEHAADACAEQCTHLPEERREEYVLIMRR